MCGLSNDKQLKFVLSQSLPSNTALTLEIKSFTNPANGRPTSPFGITVFDRDDFDIAVTMINTESKLIVQMTQPFLIT